MVRARARARVGEARRDDARHVLALAIYP